MSGTFSNLSRSPSASGRAGHPGHAYSMLSRMSRFPTLFRRDRPGQTSRMSRLSENCRGVETDQVRPERRKGCFEGLRGPHFSLDVASRLSGGAARAESSTGALWPPKVEMKADGQAKEIIVGKKIGPPSTRPSPLRRAHSNRCAWGLSGNSIRTILRCRAASDQM
jgi:hypothetical protein